MEIKRVINYGNQKSYLEKNIILHPSCFNTQLKLINRYNEKKLTKRWSGGCFPFLFDSKIDLGFLMETNIFLTVFADKEN